MPREVFPWHGNHHACSNSELFAQHVPSVLWGWTQLWMSRAARPHWLPQYFCEVSLCHQFCPCNCWSADKFGQPQPRLCAYDRWGREDREDMWPLSAQPSCKDALMVLSVLDVVVSSVDTTDRTVKAMNKLQDFVSTVYKGVWNKGQLTSVLRNSEHRTIFDKLKIFCGFVFLCTLYFILLCEKQIKEKWLTLLYHPMYTKSHFDYCPSTFHCCHLQGTQNSLEQ